MAIQLREEMTPREVLTHEWDKDMFEKQAELRVKLKEMEIDTLKLESKVNALFKLPIAVLKIPLYILLGVGYIAHAIRGTTPPEEYWNLLK